MEPTDAPFTLAPMGETIVNFCLDETDGDEATHSFKLIVSTEEVDDFLLGQESIEIGKIFVPRETRGTKGLSFGKTRKKLVHENEWFTKDLHIKLVRQLDHVTANDTTLAHRKITIKGHPSLRANVSLCAAQSATPGVGTGSDIYRVLERQDMKLLNFSDTRGENESILELTDIQNPETSRTIPWRSN